MTEQKFGWRRDNLSAPPKVRSQDQPDKKVQDAPVTADPAMEPAKTPAGPIPQPKP